MLQQHPQLSHQPYAGLQRQGSGNSYKAITFDALNSLTQKIHEISEFEHKNYFSATGSQFHIIKGTQLVDKNIINLPPPGANTLAINHPQHKSTTRLIRTAGEVARPKPSQLHQGIKASQAENPLNKEQLDMLKIQNKPQKHVNIGTSQNNYQRTTSENKKTKLFYDTNTAPQFSRSQRDQHIISKTIPLKNEHLQAHQAEYLSNQPSSAMLATPNDVFSLTQNQWKTKQKDAADQLIAHPTQFYHLKTVGFKNYKYPRPPQADQMYSPENRHRIPLYLLKDAATHQDANSIESVCVQKINHDKQQFQSLSQTMKDQHVEGYMGEDFGDQGQYDSQGQSQYNSLNVDKGRIYGSAQSNQSGRSRSKRSQKYSNRLLFEMDQYNRMLNLHNLEVKIEERNNERQQRNIFSRWKSRDSQQVQNNNIGNQSLGNNNSLISPKEQIKRNSQNYNIVSIDRINSPPLGQSQQENTNNNGQLQNTMKSKNSMQAVRMNQQSKSKKLTIIIETYNRLVRISEKYKHSGMVLEGESPQKQNKLKLLELADDNKAKMFKNQQSIYLGVFVDEFDILNANRKGITSRILYALGLDATKEFSYVSLEQLIAFYRILIHRDSAISETVKFLEKFFKEKAHNDLSTDDFKKTLRLLAAQVEEKKNDFKITMYDRLVDKFQENGVLNNETELVNFKKFKTLFMTGELNIYDIIDLICGNHE